MDIYYAIGGGLGHLTRTLAVIHTLKLKERGELTIFSDSEWANSICRPKDVPVLRCPLHGFEALEGYRHWLHTIIPEYKPNHIYVDTFPCGLYGELSGFTPPANTQIHLIARRVKWDVYRGDAGGVPPTYTTVYVTDNPYTHLHGAVSTETVPLNTVELPLEDPPTIGDPAVLNKLAVIQKDTGRPIWLIVHSNGCEIKRLLAYGKSLAEMQEVCPYWVIISPSYVPALPKKNLVQWRVYPTTPLFPHVDKIVTACGYNTMRQTLAFDYKHHYIPMVRKYDDQTRRALERDALRSLDRQHEWWNL